MATLNTVETVHVTHTIFDEDDQKTADQMDKFLLGFGLENDMERQTTNRLTVEYSAHGVPTTFEEMAQAVEKEFPGVDTKINKEYDDGEISGAPHIASTLTIFPTPFV